MTGKGWILPEQDVADGCHKHEGGNEKGPYRLYETERNWEQDEQKDELGQQPR